MNIAKTIAPNLPYLRRFSRALTGSQNSGDAYVAAVLEALIADTTQFDLEISPRTALYRAYCSLWESISINLRKTDFEPNWETTAQNQLSKIAPKAREAFLLMAVEGFTTDEVGIILGTSTSQTLALLNEASQTIVKQVATDVLIIEDEPIIAMDLERIMESLGHRVLGIARTQKEAVHMAMTKHPKLVLADIQLADGSSGLDAANQILSNFPVPIVFITAFPERLLTGDKPEPAFLITKPFLPEMVKAVVSQALFFDNEPQNAEHRNKIVQSALSL
jgi:CheY-like chemotaxis protein/DNA-directed RNA polymerase specialized sigma24 family protein